MNSKRVDKEPAGHDPSGQVPADHDPSGGDAFGGVGGLGFGAGRG